MADEDAHQDVAVLWERAIVEYTKETDRELSASVLATFRKVHSPEDLLRHIEKSEQDFGSFRNKHSSLWRALGRFVAPLTTTLNMAGTLGPVADGFGAPASAAIGACVYLVQGCEKVSEAYNWIEQVFNELQDFSERLGVYIQSRIDAVLQKKMVAILAFILRVIGRSEALIKKNRFRQFMKVTFLGKDEKTKALVEDLNKLFGSEQHYVLAVTYATTQRTEKQVESMATKVDELKEQEVSARAEDQIQRMLCINSAADDVEEIFSRNKRTLVKGTGVWLQNETLFQSWVERRAFLLWIFGGPGAGKSYLSTWIAKQIQSKRETEHDMACVAYFFVRENNQVLREANSILKTLAWQLIDQDPQFKMHAANISKKRSLTITAEDTWENLFLEYYTGAEHKPRFASVIIDGLDEATPTTRRTLLGFMKDLGSTSRSRGPLAIQFAVVGRTSLRNDVEITRFEKSYYIEVSKEKNKEDIDSYICKRLEEVQVLHAIRKRHGAKRANKDGIRLKGKILEGADGVFLWAKLLIDTIAPKDQEQIDTILKNPPADLDDMICSVFERLARDNELDHALCRKMLLLCGYARRPLSFGELNLFLSLPGRKPNWLLWKHIHGKLSSVFECRYPPGYNPENDGDPHDIENESKSANGDEPSDNEEFDFSGGFADSDSEEEGSVTDDSESGQREGVWSLHRETTDEMIQHLPEGQLKTEITFCHTRIKDYIFREGSSWLSEKPHCVVIPNSGSVQIQLLLTCLDAFRLEFALDRDKKHLMDYPLRHLAFHIKHADKSKATDQEFIRIIEGLYWLFGTECGAENFIYANCAHDKWHGTFNEFYQTWVAGPENLAQVQSWFREVRSREKLIDLSKDVVKMRWIQEAADSLETLLKPAMMKASRLWLVKPSYDSDLYFDKGEWPCRLLHGWLAWTQNDPVKTSLQDFDYSASSGTFWDLSVTRLEDLARWTDLDHDSHWHTCLGWILMEGDHRQAAKEHFMEAVKQDESAWVAMEGVARILGEEKDFSAAIEWMQRSIRSLPQRLESIRGYLWPFIADWSAELDDEATAFEAAKSGSESNSWNLQAHKTYIEALHKRGDSKTIIETIRWLDESGAKERDPGGAIQEYSQLVNLLLTNFDIFDEIGKACRDTEQPVWVLEAMDEALMQLEKHGQSEAYVHLSCKAAHFSHAWFDDQEHRTIRWSEACLQKLGQQSTSFIQEFSNREKHIRNRLAQLYFDKATELFHSAQNIAPGGNIFADKLKMLAVSVQTSFAADYEGFDFYRSDYAALLWGRWLRDYMKADGKIWRKCFKTRLLEEMSTLDDNDPGNDAFGMDRLAVSLFHAGDEKNAAAILAILFKPLENAKAAKNDSNEATESADQDETSERVNDGLFLNVTEDDGMYACDNCGCETDEVSEMYFCKICSFVNWCNECLAKVRDRTSLPGLKEHKCNAAHEMHRAWPIDQEAKSLAAEYFKGGIRLKRAWLEVMREQWLHDT